MIKEHNDNDDTIPGVVLDKSTPDYRIAHGVLGEVQRQRSIELKKEIAHELFIDVIDRKWGNISSIAQELSLPRHLVEQRIKNDPDLWQAYVNSQEKQIDLVESSIFDKAYSGDMRAASLYMEAKAKHRGWGKESKTLNVGINLKDLTIEELQQIVAGEVPESMR